MGGSDRGRQTLQALSALDALGVRLGCRCELVPVTVDGQAWFVHFTPNLEEHRRRASAGVAAATSTGLLHALWGLPEDIPVAVDSMSVDDRLVLNQMGAGHVERDGAFVTRRYRVGGIISTALVVRSRLVQAVRRAAQLPAIHRRVAVAEEKRAIKRFAAGQELSETLGIGRVLAGPGHNPSRVLTAPAAPIVGVPSVYRWWVSEIAYRNWLYANCAH